MDTALPGQCQFFKKKDCVALEMKRALENELFWRRKKTFLNNVSP